MNAKVKENCQQAKAYFKVNPVLKRFTAAFCVLPAVLYFGSTPLYFVQMWETFEGMYPLLGILSLIPAALFIADLFAVRKKAMSIAALTLGAAICVEHFFLTLFANGIIFYFFYTCAPYILAVICAAIVILLLVVTFNKNPKRDLKPFFARYKAPIAITTSLALICVLLFGVFELLPIYFSSNAVVFAVEDEYQIAWTTSADSTGCVTIAGKTYSDAVGGVNRIGRTHKVRVPMSALDEAKGYVISSHAVIANHAYLPVSGDAIERSYSFRPVDVSDGFQIYNISDNHLLQSAPSKAASYWGDKLDLFIANGDLLNDVSSEYQITLMYRFLHKVTGGAVPIIFTRGNHETRSPLADMMPNYVGSTEDGKMYFNVRLGGVRFLALDTGTDFGDDFFLLRPTHDFDAYMSEQLKWLTSQTNDGDPIVTLCHMTVPIFAYETYFTDDDKAITGFFNNGIEHLKSLNIRFMLSGHSHTIEYVPAWEKGNHTNFPYIRGSRRNDDPAQSGKRQHEKLSATEFTGTALEFKDGTWRIMFTNSKHDVLAEYSF